MISIGILHIIYSFNFNGIQLCSDTLIMVLVVYACGILAYGRLAWYFLNKKINLPISDFLMAWFDDMYFACQEVNTSIKLFRNNASFWRVQCTLQESL